MAGAFCAVPTSACLFHVLPFDRLTGVGGSLTSRPGPWRLLASRQIMRGVILLPTCYEDHLACLLKIERGADFR
jgi:hypothetical protein